MAKQRNIIRKNFDFSEEEIGQLETIREEQDCPTLISAVRFLISFYEKNKELTGEFQRDLKLNKRYLNELRRNEFILLDLLNILCIHLDISSVPSHADPQNHGTAYSDARENLKQYMHEIFTWNRTGDRELSDGFDG